MSELRQTGHRQIIETAYDLDYCPHPGTKAKIDAFFGECKFDANGIGNIEFKELESGGILNVTELHGHGASFVTPASTSDKFPDVSFFAEGDKHLNEFGFLYVALYIVGHYARYYPDAWTYDVETIHSLS